jgi:hypothetical protein
MPAGFAGGPDQPPPIAGGYSSYDPADMLFGEPQGNRAQGPVSTNPNVNAVIKAMCDRLRQINPNVTMMGLLRGSNVKLLDVVLVEGNCVNFHSFGICRRGYGCKFQHDATARPTPDRVAKFMELVKPIAENFPPGRNLKSPRGGGGPG